MSIPAGTKLTIPTHEFAKGLKSHQFVVELNLGDGGVEKKVIMMTGETDPKTGYIEVVVMHDA